MVAEIVVPDLSLALVSRSGSKVRGVLNLWKESGGKVCIQGKFSGFAPTTKHGFHIHAVGDCSTSDASSAAGHFNPENRDHGNHTSPTRHLGDLGNLTADTEGIATINQVYGKRQIQACGALLRLLTNLSMQKIFSMGGLRSEIGYRDPHESISSLGG